MTNTENTLTAIFRVAELMAGAARFTSYDCPAGYRVSRCVDCPNAYTWKGAAARPACPACGGKLTTTTRMLKAVPFIELTDELLVIAELKPNGLELEARGHELQAATYRERALDIRAKIADGRLVDDDEHPGYLREQWTDGRNSYSIVHKDAAASLSERALKHEAKAAKYRRRAAKLEAGR
jgi:hypothetical protein